MLNIIYYAVNTKISSVLKMSLLQFFVLNRDPTMMSLTKREGEAPILQKNLLQGFPVPWLGTALHLRFAKGPL